MAVTRPHTPPPGTADSACVLWAWCVGGGPVAFSRDSGTRSPLTDSIRRTGTRQGPGRRPAGTAPPRRLWTGAGSGQHANTRPASISSWRPFRGLQPPRQAACPSDSHVTPQPPGAVQAPGVGLAQMPINRARLLREVLAPPLGMTQTPFRPPSSYLLHLSCARPGLGLGLK